MNQDNYEEREFCAQAVRNAQNSESLQEFAGRIMALSVVWEKDKNKKVQTDDNGFIDPFGVGDYKNKENKNDGAKNS